MTLPPDNPDISRKIGQITLLRKEQKYDQAWLLAKALCAAYPDVHDVWRCAAYLASHEGNYQRAVEYTSKCIELMPLEPAFYHKRAQDSLYLKDFEQALQDAGKTLELGAHWNSDYYKDTALFMKAEALLHIGRPEEAAAICREIPADTGFWLGDGLRTAGDILREAGQE